MAGTGVYPITAPASGSYPLTTTLSTTITAAGLNNTNDVDNYVWNGVDSAPVGARVATTGSETYTIAAGTVTVINGTTIDGVSVAVNDVVFIATAPAASGVGTAVSVTTGLGTSQPGNGLYYVSAVAANITLVRAATMSTTSSQTNPAGRVVDVRAGGTLNAATRWQVHSPNGVAAFTYGSTAMQWRNCSLAPSLNLPNTAIQQAGINNCNIAAQSQVVVSATAYYITRSTLTMPAVPLTGMTANSTFFVWEVEMAKTAAGTGNFDIILYRGVNGSTADTADVSQTLGVQTAVVDSMRVRVLLVVTTIGATGAYYWSICPIHQAATATGFGVATGATGQFSGTVSSVAMNTASLKFGLGFKATTGTPTITIPLVEARAHNMN